MLSTLCNANWGCWFFKFNFILSFDFRLQALSTTGLFWVMNNYSLMKIHWPRLFHVLRHTELRSASKNQVIQVYPWNFDFRGFKTGPERCESVFHMGLFCISRNWYFCSMHGLNINEDDSIVNHAFIHLITITDWFCMCTESMLLLCCSLHCRSMSTVRWVTHFN